MLAERTHWLTKEGLRYGRTHAPKSFDSQRLLDDFPEE
jgi:hypothetical protein